MAFCQTAALDCRAKLHYLVKFSKEYLCTHLVHIDYYTNPDKTETATALVKLAGLAKEPLIAGTEESIKMAIQRFSNRHRDMMLFTEIVRASGKYLIADMWVHLEKDPESGNWQACQLETNIHSTLNGEYLGSKLYTVKYVDSFVDKRKKPGYYFQYAGMQTVEKLEELMGRKTEKLQKPKDAKLLPAHDETNA
ncbi:hypothetical protein MYX07_04880 [Patescibacteria group bacterium AH-259-L07]|nr:hypothetical protein [Patescibacteria group bacterium AH-259-L07]